MTSYYLKHVCTKSLCRKNRESSRNDEFVKKEGENRSHYAIICRFYWW